jgi:hypothetical protein
MTYAFIGVGHFVLLEVSFMKLSDLFRNVFKYCEELDINIKFKEDEENSESYTVTLTNNNNSSKATYYNVSSTKQLEYIIEDYLESHLN